MYTEKQLKTAKSNSRRADVALIWMPFSDLKTPTIGLSILKETLAPLHVTTELLYLNLIFGKRIGIDSYDSIMKLSPYLLAGEWIFSNGISSSDPDADEYVEKILKCTKSPYGDTIKPLSKKLIRTTLRAKLAVQSFLDDCVSIVAGLRPRVIGFSVIFQQCTASLSMARLLKNVLPEALVVFGGAGCEGSMGREFISRFSFVDAVVLGEGETALPEIVQRAMYNETLGGIEGVLTRDYGKTDRGFSLDRPIMTLITENMDDLPSPVYDDYFRQLEESGITGGRLVRRIPFETSRGCWWGEKNKCTFCGLGNDRIAYRSKSIQRVHNELRRIIEQYHPDFVAMVDNVLDRSYLDNLLPILTSEVPQTTIFWEVRVNMEKRHIQALRDAGVVLVQPGIESLSTKILKMIHKGTKAIFNIQFLKWCKEYGLNPSWHFLCGFPGESSGEYERMTELIPLIVHLTPASEAGVMRLDRFSPYFEKPDLYGLTDINPLPAYEIIYPDLGPDALAGLAYYFTFKAHSPDNLESYIRQFRDSIVEWRSSHTKSDLFFLDDGETLTVWDQRPIAIQPLIFLSGLERRLYLACDGATSLSALCRSIEGKNSSQELMVQIQAYLNSLVERLLMIREGNLYLSLAIPVGDYHPAPENWGRFQAFLKKMEESSRMEKLMDKINLKEISADVRIGEEEIKRAMEQ